MLRRVTPCLLAVLCSCGLVTGPQDPLSGTVRCGRTLKPLHDPDPALDAELQRYNFPADSFPWRLGPPVETDQFTVQHLTFPSPRQYDVEESNTVHAEYYLPRQLKGKAPAVVVLHILDGRFLVARMLCRNFAAAGIPSLMVQMPYYGDRRPPGTSLYRTFISDPRRMFDAMQGTVVDVRRAACWLQARREVDPRRIGVVGVSLGAISAALVAGVDPRFSRNVVVLGGGDPAAILWHAPETEAVRDRLVALGYDLARTRELARGVDPIPFARRADTKRVLMINATSDATMPRECTMALWEALGKPTIHWYPAGHYTMALFVPAILPTAVEFIVNTPPGR